MDIGTGCPGALGTPSLTLSAPWTLPRLGDTLAVTLSGLPVNLGGLGMGFSDQVFAGSPLPLDLTPRGMPGCRVHAAPEATVFLVGQNHAAELSLAIPNATFLLGLAFYQQGFAVDPGANAAGLTLTNSMQGLIGRR
jgi:hypothetical protein